MVAGTATRGFGARTRRESAGRRRPLSPDRAAGGRGTGGGDQIASSLPWQPSAAEHECSGVIDTLFFSLYPLPRFYPPIPSPRPHLSYPPVDPQSSPFAIAFCFPCVFYSILYVSRVRFRSFALLELSLSHRCYHHAVIRSESQSPKCVWSQAYTGLSGPQTSYDSNSRSSCRALNVRDRLTPGSKESTSTSFPTAFDSGISKQIDKYPHGAPNAVEVDFRTIVATDSFGIRRGCRSTF